MLRDCSISWVCSLIFLQVLKVNGYTFSGGVFMDISTETHINELILL